MEFPTFHIEDTFLCKANKDSYSEAAQLMFLKNQGIYRTRHY